MKKRESVKEKVVQSVGWIRGMSKKIGEDIMCDFVIGNKALFFPEPKPLSEIDEAFYQWKGLIESARAAR